MSKEYHILSLSGGKDSTALAFYIKDNMPEIHKQIEYVFCDTGAEFPELYDYLNKIEVFLNKKIEILHPKKSFDEIYESSGIIPSVVRRWCTVELKTKSFKKYIQNKIGNNDNSIINIYIGIRADEATRIKSSKLNRIMNEIHPFIDGGISKKDVENILIKSGIGIPDFYKWRSRSGCYFCFFQSKKDWINLYEHQPELFKKAMSYEINSPKSDKFERFGWNTEMSLAEMILPENIKKIKSDYKKFRAKKLVKDVHKETLFDLATKII